MNTLKYIIPFFCLIILASSCDEDTFTSVVEIEIPEHSPLPAVTCSFKAGDTYIETFVSKSQQITGEPDFEIVDNAEVRFFKNDNLWETVDFHEGAQKYILSGVGPVPADGATYRLEVLVPGFETVTATQTMPAAPTIQNLNFTEDGGVDLYGDRVNKVTLDIVDQAGVDNYYAIELLHFRTFDNEEYYEELYFNSTDPLIEYGNEYMLLDDASFEGGTYSLDAGIGNWQFQNPEPGEAIIAKVYSLTRDDYLYNRSLDIYYNSEGNPFAEPVVVQDNIENGYGIFRLGSPTELTYEF